MSEHQQKLLIIDSGIGGLSILNEIRQAMPFIHSSYIADNAHYPYGTKSEQAIIDRVLDLALQAIEKDQFSALVLACNTASTVCLPTLRRSLDIPVIGVVPAIKPAAAQSQTKVIGLLATPGTVERQYTKDLIQTFASDCTVINVGSSRLVDMAENTRENKPHPNEDYEEVLQPFWDHPQSSLIDTIVLGCTHFPLLLNELDLAVGKRHIRWVDSGAAIAKQIKLNILKLDDGIDQLKEASIGQHTLFFTAKKNISSNLETSLKDLGIDQISFL